MTPLPRLYLANLLALVTTGVLVSGWLLYYTESFEVVGGLLGLGGLFAWAAFVVGLLSEKRKEDLQDIFEEQVLVRWRTTLACAVIVIGLGVLTSMSGTLVLDADAEESDRIVSVSTADSDSTASSRVPARSVRRLWFLTPFGGTSVRVKVDGLPGIQADLRPPLRTRLAVPSSFVGRRLLLVRPGQLHSGTASTDPDGYELLVRLDAQTGRVHPYGGQSVWIGTDEDVSVPEDLLKRWRESLTASALSAISGEGQGASLTLPLSIVETVLARWATPGAALTDTALREGQHATVAIRRLSDKHELISKTIVVRRAGAGDAIQEVILE